MMASTTAIITKGISPVVLPPVCFPLPGGGGRNASWTVSTALAVAHVQIPRKQTRRKTSRQMGRRRQCWPWRWTSPREAKREGGREGKEKACEKEAEDGEEGKRGDGRGEYVGSKDVKERDR